MIRVITAVFFLFAAHHSTANADLIRNGGFEDVPGTIQGQGLMPSEWLTVSSSPDTYSNDGSYGLSPGDFNNWVPGTVAFEGIRWVAGGRTATITESFGQLLSSPLTPGVEYTLSGSLKEGSSRESGGYEISLADNDAGANAVSLGILGYTVDPFDDWVEHSIVFTAPLSAASKPFLLFEPVRDLSSGSTSAYPGLDAVSLTSMSVPEPSQIALFAIASVISLTFWRPQGGGISLPRSVFRTSIGGVRCGRPAS